jgi:hypothetical protein
VMQMYGCAFRRALEIVSQRRGEPARASREAASGFERAGASPLAAKRPGNSDRQSEQSARAKIEAKLEATKRRLAALDATNRAASQALATACEPDRSSPFT